MPQAFSTGIEVPTASDRHPSEAWWARVGATTNAAILNETAKVRTAATASVDALRKTVTQDYVDRATASQYGIPGPATTIRIGTVQGGTTAAASMTGTSPSQTLSLTLPQGPRGPEGPGGAYRMVETSDPGLFAASETPVAPWDPAWNRGVVPAGTDLNTLRTANHAGVWELSATGGYVNAPFAAAGHLLVTVAKASARQVAVRLSGAKETWSRSSASSTAWWAWDAVEVQQPPAGMDLNGLRSNAEYVIRNTTDANAVTAGWPDELGIARSAARISVRVTTTGLVFQQMQTYGADPRLLIRSTAATSPSPYPFSSWKDATAPAPAATGGAAVGAHAGIANALLLQDFTRRRPVIRTGGKPALALRFDHGLANFNNLIVPILKRLKLPAALALNAGDWDRSENGGVTANTVNGWVQEGWLEIWNHSLNHMAPPEDPAALTEQIVTGLSKLRSDLPAAVIDGYMPAGTAGDTTGFNGGDTAEAWWNTAPGRLILQHHAVASGYILDTAYRVLDGQPRQGQGHFTMDTMNVTDVKARIQAAYAPARGLQLMLHPSRLNTSGYMTSADFVSLLEWIAAERDAGRLIALGAYDMLRAAA